MIWILGDNHGHFDHVMQAVKTTGEHPAAVIFLGDLECPVPFSQCVAEIEAAGIRCYAIPGNHDTDRSEFYVNLWGDPLFQSRNLHGRVVEIGGVRVAELGGVFRSRVWYPDGDGLAEPVIECWGAFVKDQNLRRPTRLRVDPKTLTPAQLAMDSALRGQASSIFYDDWLQLYCQQADILVTHEAPDCHPNGFKPITALEQSMHVKFRFHGHQHDSLNFRQHAEALEFQAFGVGFCGISDMFGDRIKPDDFDEARRHREEIGFKP